MSGTEKTVGFESRLHALAEVTVRIGLNLQAGQRLLITEPYELQGVARSAECIVEAVRAVAGGEVEVIWGDGARLREFAGKNDTRGFAQLVEANVARMANAIRDGDALLFLQGSQPHLMAGIAPGRIAELRRIGAEGFGAIAQQLVQGATNWTAMPAPSPGWAKVAYADLPGEERLDALWEAVFEACRVPALNVGGSLPPDSFKSGHKAPPTTETVLAVWQIHLAALARRRDALNARRLKTLRYAGAGTDLTVTLPAEHLWCTAQLKTKAGRPFVANLPTEEIFTAPHKDSADGIVRVGRPVAYGGAVLEGVELKFSRGRIVEAQARTGATLLEQMLEIDEGAAQLGEVAIVGNGGGGLSPDSRPSGPITPPASWSHSGRLFYHPLLDENASHHLALGDAYGFCLRSPDRSALNRSLLHLDLPIDAAVVFPETEPA